MKLFESLQNTMSLSNNNNKSGGRRCGGIVPTATKDLILIVLVAVLLLLITTGTKERTSLVVFHLRLATNEIYKTTWLVVDLHKFNCFALVKCVQVPNTN